MRSRWLALAALLSTPACAALQEPSEAPAPEPDAEREIRHASPADVERALARLRAAAARPRVAEVPELRFDPPAGERWSLVAQGGATVCTLPCARATEGLRGARVVRGAAAGGVSLPVPEYLTSSTDSAVVRVVPPRGSPTGALVLGIAGGNTLVFGGALALGFCRESENNRVQSDAGCGAAIAASIGGAAALAAAIGWGVWSRRARLEPTVSR